MDAAVSELAARAGIADGSCKHVMLTQVGAQLADAGFDLSIVQQNYDKLGRPMPASSTVHTEWIVRIYYPNVAQDDLPWDLLHELGHVLQGDPSGTDLRSLARESDAWDRGWAFAVHRTAGAIEADEQSFLRRREACLSTYRVGTAITPG